MFLELCNLFKADFLSQVIEVKFQLNSSKRVLKTVMQYILLSLKGFTWN